MRYIDADKLKADIKEITEITDGKLTEFEALGILSGQPTADVRENVKGEWITANEQPYFRKHYNNVVCSVCHRKGDSRWNFCPNCGAKMRGEQNG